MIQNGVGQFLFYERLHENFHVGSREKMPSSRRFRSLQLSSEIFADEEVHK